jgi:hypothetical protein
VLEGVVGGNYRVGSLGSWCNRRRRWRSVLQAMIPIFAGATMAGSMRGLSLDNWSDNLLSLAEDPDHRHRLASRHNAHARLRADA